MPTVHVTGSQARALGRRLQQGSLVAAAQPRARNRRLAKLVVVANDGKPRRACARVSYTSEGWSKNLAWRYRKSTGRHYLTDAARQARAALAKMVAADAGRRPWPTKKTYLTIEVWRADMRGDPLNVLDGVADAVRDAIGVDDRHFAVRRLDWRLIERPKSYNPARDGELQQPCIFVVVEQEGL